MNFYIANVGYSLLMAVLAWIVSIALIWGASKLFWLYRNHQNYFLGALVVFGLMPLIIMPPILSAIGQPSFTFADLQFFVLEIAFIAFVCALPGVLAVNRAVFDVHLKYGGLLFMSNLSRPDSYHKIGRPFIVSAAIPPIRATIPMAILLTVVLEWARGGGAGLGVITQNVMANGVWTDRWELILSLGFPSLIAYQCFVWIEKSWNRRCEISHHTEIDSQIDQGGANGRNAILMGMFFGLLVVIMSWHLALSADYIDSSQRFTPVRFFHKFLDISNMDTITKGNLLSLLISSVLNTVGLAVLASIIGVVFAGIFAMIARLSKYLQGTLSVVSSITQTVPLFLFIPFYLSFFKSENVVALLVCISATYFVGYEIFRSKLEQLPEDWQNLNGLTALTSSLSNNLSMFWRQIRHWYIPLMQSLAFLAIIITLPSGFIAALVADMFLGLGGLAELATVIGRTDLFINILVVTIIFTLMVSAYLFGRVIEQRTIQ